LGVIMYELFTGRLPFDEPTLMETLIARAQKPAPPPRDFNPKLPPQLEAICLHALEVDPARRFASMHELRDALEDPDRYFAGNSAKPVVMAQPYRRRTTTLKVQRTAAGPLVTTAWRLGAAQWGLLAGALAAAVAVLIAAWLIRPRELDPSPKSVPQATAVLPSTNPTTEPVRTANHPTATATARASRERAQKPPRASRALVASPDPAITLIDPAWAAPRESARGVVERVR
jgi:serine/threonine protein kinase